MASLAYELVNKGYLTLNKFIRYLAETQSAAQISYPTALRMIERGELEAVKIGSQWRISRRVVENWVAGKGGAQGENLGLDLSPVDPSKLL